MTFFIISMSLLGIFINILGLAMIIQSIANLSARNDEKQDNEFEIEGSYEIKIQPNGMYALVENGIVIKRASTSYGIQNEMDDYFRTIRHLKRKLGDKK